MNDSSDTSARYWCIVPAAGIGSRVQSSIPKQYLSLKDKSIIEHTLDRLLGVEQIEKIIVALHPGDSWWSELPVSQHPDIETVIGGSERHDSVANALNHLKNRADHNDWVLVHDAARPCVTVSDIKKLIQATFNHPIGGLLGTPVSDTIKRVDKNLVTATIDRDSLWNALTPQVFRFDCLYRALSAENGFDRFTDEAMAIERTGLQPLMVEGSKDNIKITVPGDISLAAVILQSQGIF